MNEKIGEEKLKSMLESINAGEQKKQTKITFHRKRYGDDDDDEEYDL